jgi:hypothetical protein
MQIHAGMNVFCDGLGLESSDFHQGLPAEDAAAASKESAVVSITTGLERTEEERLFVLHFLADTQIPLKNILIVEVMRRLHDCDLRVVKKPDGLFEKCSRWDVIHVEDRD